MKLEVTELTLRLTVEMTIKSMTNLILQPGRQSHVVSSTPKNAGLQVKFANSFLRRHRLPINKFRHSLVALADVISGFHDFFNNTCDVFL